MSRLIQVSTRVAHSATTPPYLLPGEASTQPENRATMYDYIDLPPGASRFPTENFRYLIRLAGFVIPKGKVGTVHGLSQYLEIGGPLRASGSLVYQQVTTPMWRFYDANVCWALRFHSRADDRTNISAHGPGFTPSYWGTQQGIIFKGDGAPYEAPRGGYFPGETSEELGYFNDIRFPHQRQSCLCMEIPFRGPGVVALYASVRQTNPATRTPLVLDGSAGGIPENEQAISALAPEDRFLALVPNARYTKIAGSIAYRLSVSKKRSC